MAKYDLEELNNIPIGEVLEHFDVEALKNNKFRCPNNHQKNKAVITVYTDDNICKCHNCGEVKGDSIAVAKFFHNGDFKNACEDLHEAFNIPFLDGGVASKTSHKFIKKSFIKKEIEYLSFDENHKYLEVNISSYFDKYNDMTEVQQFKMIATTIYQFSLTTDQTLKNSYYKNIGITKEKNPILKEKILMIDSNLGFISKDDVSKLLKHLQVLIPVEDLVKYGVINDSLDKKPFAFSQSIVEGLVVIPNFDMYTNMCSGLKYRKTKLKSWFDKKLQKKVFDSNKEPEFSYRRIAHPLPYHLAREALLNKSFSFRFFEGQKDLHSMPSKELVCDIAIPGVNGIDETMLGLFRGRKVELYFDQDKRGQEGAMKLKALLEKAGAFVTNNTWDLSLGDDINNVLLNNNILEIL